MAIKKIESYVAVCDWCGEVALHGGPFFIISENLTKVFYDKAWHCTYDSKNEKEIILCPDCVKRWERKRDREGRLTEGENCNENTR